MYSRHSESPYRQALADLRGGFFVVGAISAVIGVLMLTGSIYMLQVYDRVLGSGSVPTLLSLFGIVVVLYVFLAFYDGLRMRLLSRLSLQLDGALSAMAFRRDLVLRDRSDRSTSRSLEALRDLISGTPMLALFDLPFTVLFLAVLFVLHPVLGLLTVFGMVLAGLLALANRMALREPMADAQLACALQRRFALSARQAAPVLRALGMGTAVTLRWQAMQHRTLAHQQRGNEPSATLAALSRGLRMLLQSALLTAGAWLVINGAMTAGSIVAASILSGRALAPVDQLIGNWRSVAAGLDAHRQLRRSLLAPPSQVLDLPELTGALEVSGLVCLGMPGVGGARRPRILDELSFSLAPGDGLGIVGASASGKSTIARVIVGALTPDSGEIRFDGATASQYDADRLGSQIGYLPQRIDLLSGSVRDNIARFDPGVRDEAVIRAANAAGVHEMILRLPHGYATEIGGAETPLSGGQIQRIALARALYGEPKILILDEPNAHLDMAGEAALTKVLQERRAHGVTVIVMAHRAGALAAVDRLMVLRDGKISLDGLRKDILPLLSGGVSPRHAQVRIRPTKSHEPAPPQATNIFASSISEGSAGEEPLPIMPRRLLIRAHPRAV